LVLISLSAFTSADESPRAGGSGRASAPAAVGEASYDSLDAAIADLVASSPKSQIAAARWITGQGKDAALKALPTAIRLLAEGDVARERASHAGRVTPRTAVADLIRKAGPAALAPLVAAFDSKNAVLKANLLPFIAALEGDAVLPTLILATRDPAEPVRAAAATYLSRFQHADAATAILALLDDASPLVRTQAANAVEAIAAAPESSRRPASKSTVTNVQRQQIAAKLSKLLTDDPAENVQICAARSLGALRPNDLSALVAAVEKPALRMYAVQGLAATADPRATAALLKVLHTPIPLDWPQHQRQHGEYARMSAARGLSASRDLRAVDALMAIVVDGNDSILVREAAAEALGDIGDRRATPALVAALNLQAARPPAGNQPANPFPLHERLEAAVALSLGKLRDPAAVQPLIALLSVGTSRGIQEAARALGELGDVSAVEPLVALLLRSEDNAYAVDAAAAGLLKIRSRKVVQLLIEGNQTAATHGYATHIARRTVDKITGSDLAFAGPDVVAGWWKEHQAEWTDPAPKEPRTK
jgi:HEAT repeat protein